MKYFAFISLLTVSLTLTTASSAYPKHNSQGAPEQSQQTDEFIKRLKDKRALGLMESATWTLTHDYSNFSRVDEILNTMKDFFEAIAKYERGDRSSLEEIGGVKVFKDKMAALLTDDDQAARSFAAIMLGISGDREYAPQIARLLKVIKQEGKHGRYDRGRASVALGLLGAKEYISDLAVLLRSDNPHDRSGAAQGIGLMGAKDQAKAVALLLDDEDEVVREAAMQSLELMGATEFIKKRK
jgi:HEAT repeat protein